MTWAFLDGEKPAALAHRGGRPSTQFAAATPGAANPVPEKSVPGNTVAAFDLAVGLGYQYLETDVRLSADGVLVAFHDDVIEHQAATSISELSWNEIAEFDLGAGHRIPQLAELLDRYPTARFNIEPKTDQAVEPLASLILRHNALDRVCIGSFNDQRISRSMQILGPRLCTSAGRNHASSIAAQALAGFGLRTGGHACLQIPMSAGPIKISRRMIEGVHRMGMEVHVWTINSETDMHELLDMGVDALISDEIYLLKEVLISRGQWY